MWTVYLRGQAIPVGLTDDDKALIRVDRLMAVLGLTKRVDEQAAAIYLDELTAPTETWEELAGRMGRLAGLTDEEVLLTCATVEAETEGNNLLVEYTEDDGGKRIVGGAGYGQMWPRWHAERITDAVAALDRPFLPPPLANSEDALNTILFVDREVSMLAVATLVRDLWRDKGGNWDRFTEAYVGPAIPDDDRDRRRRIWDRWSGQA